MGFYIQGPARGKAQMLCEQHNGVRLDGPPESYQELPEDKALVVVVNNGPFEAAGLCYNEREFDDFTSDSDPRPKEFVLLDKLTAYRLAGYKD